MKHLLWATVAAAAIAGCGGGARSPAEPKPEPKKSACTAAAENVAGLVIRAKVDDMTEAQRPDIVRILTERCEADAWSDELVACLTSVTDAGAEAEIEKCGDMLTEAQEEAVEAQLERELPRPEREMESSDETMEGGSGAKPKGAAPPPPPDDPCGGGA